MRAKRTSRPSNADIVLEVWVDDKNDNVDDCHHSRFWLCRRHILHTPVEAAAEGLVTVTPSQVFVGEEITVTLEGFRSNSRIVAGNVSLGDLRLPVPGYLNYPGSQPVTDSHGWVTFSSHVPRQVAIGPQKVVVDWGQETERTTTFTVLSASLAVTP